MNARSNSAAPSTPPIVRELEVPAAPGQGVPLVLDRDTMTAALADGGAVPLTAIVTSLVRHRDRWWLDAVDEWLLITDQAFAASLDAHHARAH
jgi:hypothetical protein